MLQVLLVLALAAQELTWMREPHTEQLPSSVLDILERAEVLTIFALNPQTPDSPPYTVGPANSDHEEFDFYPVIGKARVTDSRQLREVTSALRKDIRGAGVSACFYPRHGVRAEVSGQHVDFVICFECRETIVVVGEEMRGRVRIDHNSLDVLNKVLKANGVTPLTPPTEELK
jgi:hypothetical protein